MRRWIWRFIVAFRTNNNVRLAVLWGITGFLLVFNLFIFGVGPVPESTVGEIAQRYYNEYYRGEFVTDAELHRIAAFFGGLGGSFRAIVWWFWFGLLISGIVYTPIAFRDEVVRALQAAWRQVRQRRGGEEEANLPPIGGQPPPQQQTPPPPTVGPQQPSFLRLFLSDLLGSWISHRFEGR